MSCECLADEHYEGPCKHRVAIAIRKPILDTIDEVQLVTDGGPLMEENSISREGRGVDTDEPSECDCEALMNDFPCWACVESGRRELPGSREEVSR